MHILLLSAYDTDSHSAWCKGLKEALSQHQWTYLTLPGRFFSWRIRGNGLSFAFSEHADLLKKSYDLVIATSMVDLATLKGLCPSLSNTPSIVYFHENQFAYPKSQQQHTSIEPQMVNLYSALSAQWVLFNSEYNRSSFLQGARSLLKKLPDHAPTAAIDAIERKSQVIPVPIAPPATPACKHFEKGRTLSVIWNHRWEYDKGPDTLKEVIEQAQHSNLDVEFTICGMSFRNQPQAFLDLKKRPLKNIKHLGTFQQKQDYLLALSQHHVVLSTAIHEFQGLAVLEGASLGCTPLAPQRLAYPEWIPKACLYPSSTVKQEAQCICATLKEWQHMGLPSPPKVEAYYWQNLKHEYEGIIQKVKSLENATQPTCQ